MKECNPFANTYTVSFVKSTEVTEKSTLQHDQDQDYLLRIYGFSAGLKSLGPNLRQTYRQEIVRLKSACSHKYLTLRDSTIGASVDRDEAFADAFSNLNL